MRQEQQIHQIQELKKFPPWLAYILATHCVIAGWMLPKINLASLNASYLPAIYAEAATPLLFGLAATIGKRRSWESRFLVGFIVFATLAYAIAIISK